MHSHNTAQLAEQNADQIPLLEGLSASDRRAVLEAGQTVQLEPGATIIQQGTRSHRLWILVEGTCEVLLDAPPQHTPFLLATLEPMTCFGEMSFFSDATHSASVVAKTPVSLVRFDRDDFEHVVSQHPEAACHVARNVIRSLADRLRRMDQWVAELAAAGDKPQRVDELHQLRDKLFDGWKV